MGGLCSRSGETVDINAIINSADIVVFSSPTCPYCQKAIGALRDSGYNPKVVDADRATRDALAMKVGASSVPQVFVKGQHVGGCNDGGLGGTIPLLMSGKIAEMMNG